jgi:NAD synthase
MPVNLANLGQRCSSCLRFYKITDSAGNAITKAPLLCKWCSQASSINIQARKILAKKQLQLFLSYQGKDSPVLVAFSGGADSALALYLAKKELKLDVIAFKLSNYWERPQVEEQAKRFCERLGIPFLIAHVDFRAMFIKRYPKLNKVDPKTIIAYPWCRLCAEDGGLVWAGISEVATQLEIQRIVTGNNFFVFGQKPFVKEQPAAKRFFKKHTVLLNSASLLWNIPYADGIAIHLPLAFGYTKQKKMLKLSEIGYSLPAEYLCAPESDCLLGTLLPCAARQLNDAQQEPKASTYFEFLSGYITRQEWITALKLANGFSAVDSHKAFTEMKRKLEYSTVKYAIQIEFSQSFLRKYRKINLLKFSIALKKALRNEEHCVHAQYYFGRQEFSKAIKEAGLARLTEKDPRAKKNTSIMGFAYAKIGNKKKALRYLIKANS